MDFILNFVDFFLHIDDHLVTVFQEYGLLIYGILFLIIFCETGLVVTPILPGDSLLFASGALCAKVASESSLSVHILVALLIVAAILGDGLNYFLGKFFGEKAFTKFPKIFRPQYLKKTQSFYDRYGGKTIIFARFIPIVRTFAPFLAGVGSMSYNKFLSYNIIGGILWIVMFCYGGYVFGQIEFVKNNFSMFILGIIFVSVIPVVIELFRGDSDEKAKV